MLISCPERFTDHAQRWFTLSFTHSFTRVNVFSLGHTYLQLVQILKVRSPPIDPTFYIYCFAKHLDSGSEQTKVAKGALPDLTIQKRLDEFKETKSGGLTVEESRNMWLEQEHDPPSYGSKASKGRKRVRDINDDGEVIQDPQNISIVSAPVDIWAAPPPATPPSAPPSCPTPHTLLNKPLRPGADGFVIPELTVPSPLPISSLPGIPMDITDPPSHRNASTMPKVTNTPLSRWKAQRGRPPMKCLKETDLRNSFIKNAKKCNRDKSRDSNSKEMAATFAYSAKEMLMRWSYFEEINYKVIEGPYEDD
ncbi:hypothetical protein HOY82DRAFT_674025 [Tuber indicum]|nr:hypothetical protein HOY82DRAFT_674025 [Tuber indicum]